MIKQMKLMNPLKVLWGCDGWMGDDTRWKESIGRRRGLLLRSRTEGGRSG
jgi:hypothetical protein